MLLPQEVRPTKINNFFGGLNTKISELNGMATTDTPDCMNVYSDVDGSLTKRNGRTKLNSSVVNSGVSDIYTGLLLRADGADGAITFTDDTGKTVVNTETYDSYDKLMLHGDGTDLATTITDEIGKTVTNTAAYDTYTKLASHFDGADAAVAYTDPVAGAYTFVGTAQLDTAQKKFGTASLLLDGNSDYVTLPDSASWAFGSAAFTIDLWVRFAALPTDGNYFAIFSQDDTGAAKFSRCNLSNSGGVYSFTWQINIGGDLILDTAGGNTASLAINTWYHFALVRNSDTLTIYQGGVSIGTSAFDVGSSYPDCDKILVIGSSDGGGNYFNGWIDELRISKGIARWTAAFTPPVAPYGQVTIDTGVKKFGTGSMLFDGSGSVAALATSADWDWGTSAFTIDCWIYPLLLTDMGSERTILNNQYNTVGKNGNWKLSIGVTGELNFYTYDEQGSYESVVTTSAGITINTWTHIAIIRSSNTITLYVNGVSKGTGTVTKSLGDTTPTIRIGDDSGQTGFFNGYIDELRISKGVARWTGNFTPNIQSYGQVRITTDQYKFGGSSMVYDGGGNLLSIADHADFYFSDDDFTIETWIRFNQIGLLQVICGQYEDSSNYWFAQITSANKLQIKFVDGGASKGDYIMTSAWSGLAIATWYHIAIVRSTISAKIFIGGVSQTLTETTAFSTNDVGDMGAAFIVGNQNSISNLYAFLDDLRVSNGIARYSATFTPATIGYGVGTCYGLFDYNYVNTKLLVGAFGTKIVKMEELDGTFDDLDTTQEEVRHYFDNYAGTLLITDYNYSRPNSWDGTASTITELTSAPLARYVKNAYNYIFYWNIKDNPSRLQRSDYGDHTAYTATSYNDISTNDGDWGTGLGFLKGVLYAFKGWSIHKVSYLGGTPLLDIRQMTTGIGAVSYDTIKNITIPGKGEVLIFLGSDKKLYIFDGYSAAPVSIKFEKKNGISPISLDSLNTGGLKYSHAVVDENKHWYILYVANGGSSNITHALVFNYHTNACWPFSNQTLGASVVSIDGNGKKWIIVGDYSGFAHKWDYGNKDDTTTIDAYHTTPKVFISSPSVLDKVRQVRIDTKTISDDTLNFYHREDYDKSWSTAESIPLYSSDNEYYLGTTFSLGTATLGANNFVVNSTIDLPYLSNFMQFKISDSLTTKPWALYSYDFLSLPIGYSKQQT